MEALLVKIMAYRVAILYLALSLQQAVEMVRTNLVALVALVALAVVEQAVAAPQREAVAQEYLDKAIVVGQELE